MKTVKSIVQSNDGKFTEITYRGNTIDINVVDKFKLDEEEVVLKLKDECIRLSKDGEGCYSFKRVAKLEDTVMSDKDREEIKNIIKETMDEYYQNNITKIDKLELNENDVLIQRIPCDEDGQITMPYEEVSAYHKALQKELNCEVMTLPESLHFQVLSIDSLKQYRDMINNLISCKEEIK